MLLLLFEFAINIISNGQRPRETNRCTYMTQTNYILRNRNSSTTTVSIKYARRRTSA